MSIVSDLEKLVALRTEGALTEEEFANAKLQLFQTKPRHESVDTDPVGSDVQCVDQIFCSSRWSAGNCFFPDSIILAKDGIMFRKRGLFGSNEEHLNYQAVASCRIKNGIFLANISIETTGGSQPIYINGLWKSEAKTILEVVRARQEG